MSRRDVDYVAGNSCSSSSDRAQSRGEAISTDQGEMVAFTTRSRPVRGARGYVRTAMRHGVSRVTWGSRDTLGVIFHDAQ